MFISLKGGTFMKEVKISFLSIEPSSSIKIQGNRESLEWHLQRGYYIKEMRDDCWVLLKIEKVIAAIEKSPKSQMFNIQKQICEHYRKKRISQPLFDRFCKDLRANKLKIYLDDDHLVIKKNTPVE